MYTLVFMMMMMMMMMAWFDGIVVTNVPILFLVSLTKPLTFRACFISCTIPLYYLVS